LGQLGVLVWSNHEIIIVTGSNNDVVYFEPNFGFFRRAMLVRIMHKLLNLLSISNGQYNMKAGNFI
jgi:hypothetical protein